jgi:hypothetical protein
MFIYELYAEVHTYLHTYIHTQTLKSKVEFTASWPLIEILLIRPLKEIMCRVSCLPFHQKQVYPAAVAKETFRNSGLTCNVRVLMALKLL